MRRVIPKSGSSARPAKRQWFQRVAILLSFFLLASTGCRKATTVVAALTCRAACEPADGKSTGHWRYEGFDAGRPPRSRPGSYATATRSVRFLDLADLGHHAYRLSWSERNGIVYTCKAGHIDIAHVRKGIDWTAFLAAMVLGHLERGQSHFQFKLYEPSRYVVELAYPEHWNALPIQDRRRVARETALELGQYFAYTALTWHEIITWFGYKFKGFQSEFPSAFSWEDTYSNVLGTHVAGLVLQGAHRDFDEAVTAALERALRDLDIQSAETARQAAESVSDWWYSWDVVGTVVRKRNLDIGLGDHRVTPCLVPSVPGYHGAEGRPLLVPTLDRVAACGFSVRLEIEPREWERERVLSIVYPDAEQRRERFEPAVHFAKIMDHIACDAERRYGPEACAGDPHVLVGGTKRLP